VTYPDRYGDREGWRDPQGRNQPSAYRQGPYQQDPYRGVRLSLLAASLVAGLAIALLTVHLAGAW